MKMLLKKRKILLAAAGAYALVFFLDQPLFLKAAGVTLGYVREMLEILPAVFIITGLVDVWVSRDTIMRYFGSNSGVKGKFASLLIGSVSAGPIYAAFPVTSSLLKKGASLSNVVIILSAWAVVKVPMLLVEAKFLGLEFMGARYLLTLPGILLIAFATEKLVKREEVMEAMEKKDEQLLNQILGELPGYNCGSCGHLNCSDFAKALSL
ncbi:MAG: permease, partial [Candidatus Thermoplasmatota archaeon]|nr:permease [Candidatus Thermoplasmatota archaeon]